MFEWPWVTARKRREAKQAEADRVGKLLREEKERRAAQILADQIHRSRIAALHRSQPRPASVTPIKATGYGLTAQRAAQEDQRKRDEEDTRKRRQSSDSTAYGLDQTQMAFASSLPESSTEVSHKLSGGGGTFDGGGASGDWSSGSGSSSSDSSSSSSDSGSSSGGSD